MVPSNSAASAMYPQVADEIPGDVPGINTGFHCTSAEPERTKSLDISRD
jgi:hypothetical protein